jgi:hypothetical protein
MGLRLFANEKKTGRSIEPSIGLMAHLKLAWVLDSGARTGQGKAALLKSAVYRIHGLKL